jgi:N-succinyl-L-ornithine transcarbamylase
VNAWGEADFVITHPEDYELDKAFTQNAKITTTRMKLWKALISFM